MKNQKARDVEKEYPKKDFISKLRRFADALEQGKKFSIQVKGRKLNIPKGALVNIEHESNSKEEELEFQVRWNK